MCNILTINKYEVSVIYINKQYAVQKLNIIKKNIVLINKQKKNNNF